MPTTPVILDVDTGIDDALALMLAVRHPALDVRAITCVAGNVDRDQVVRNTLGILSLVGAPDIPVGAGAAAPLVQEPRPADHVHGGDGVGGVALPQDGRTADGRGALELMRAALEAAPAPVTLICLAPLTNLALLLRAHPEAAARIGRIVWMGGAIGAGNATASAEFNAWHDPEAAAVVVGSGIPLLMYGLEPFYQAAVPAGAIDELASSPDPVAAAVGALLRRSQEMGAGEARLPFPDAATLGDAGAVAVAIDESLAACTEAPVAVELRGELTRGRTVVDLREAAVDLHGHAQAPHRAPLRHTTPGAATTVVTGVDGGAVRELFFTTVLGPHAPTLGEAPHGTATAPDTAREPVASASAPAHTSASSTSSERGAR
ncbi:nucleoside hydrolase [Brevibacterium sp. 5221]|uniref:Nucleoside hydrolase n=1 Tax=Brevibacterium rongguiense TaxID=2695267 RepID=A0A6N9H597_9MICO|nr:nucleoside hydrolase [Brevibacterium rongguiense]MYM19105.1 nucleoside hydrolase [Brevibacterium rongguiense]